MIGLRPAFSAWRRNCQAPYSVPWSVSASAGMPRSRVREIRSDSRFAPSSSENSEWVWRWTKDIPMRDSGSGPAGRLPPALERTQECFELDHVLVLLVPRRVEPRVQEVAAVLARTVDHPGDERAALDRKSTRLN